MHVVQFSLIGIATFVGVMTSGSDRTRTTWSARATVWHDSQLAYATAAFVSSTTSPPARRIEKAKSNSVEPSFSLTATAVLSPDADAVGAARARSAPRAAR